MGKQTITRDRRIYDDDLKIKTTNIDETYPKLPAFGEIRPKYHIKIYWWDNRTCTEKIKLPANSKNSSLEKANESKYKHTVISSVEKFV